MTTISFPRRLDLLAAYDPDRPAVTCGDASLSRDQLRRRSNRLARALLEHGVAHGDFVTIALENGIDWFVAAAAAWRVGAIPQPVSPRLPARELAAIVGLARPRVVIGGDVSALDLLDDEPRARTAHFDGVPAAAGTDDGPLPDVVSPAWKAPTSGGSTGRPKLIVAGDPASGDFSGAPPLRMVADGCLVMPGPLYHNAPFVWSSWALLHGAHVVLLPRFDALATLAAVEHHRADTLYLVPTMMKRILRLPERDRLGADLSSLRVVWHVAEPCPAWLKRAWIDWLGPERIWEAYGGTEGHMSAHIRGDEWLVRPGSVGRLATGEAIVCDENGRPVGPGEIGEIWARPRGRSTPTFRYIGDAPRALEGGWVSLGDVGWFDADGYLYLADRKQDMILRGGANVYPAEVEAALTEHPAVGSAAVIGLPDADLGQIVHAIVEADELRVTPDDLRAFVAERLAKYKVPRSFEYTTEPLRDEAGKVRRTALRAARLAPDFTHMPADIPSGQQSDDQPST